MLHKNFCLQFLNLFTECSKIVLPLPILTIFCVKFASIIVFGIILQKIEIDITNCTINKSIFCFSLHSRYRKDVLKGLFNKTTIRVTKCNNNKGDTIHSQHLKIFLPKQ